MKVNTSGNGNGLSSENLNQNIVNYGTNSGVHIGSTNFYISEYILGEKCCI